MSRYLFLLCLLSVSCWAQVVPGALQCVANAAVPPTLRSEGLTELTGDIVIDCTGGTPTPLNLPVPQTNINIFLNTRATSRILSGSTSEALLMIDEPGPGNQSLAAPNVVVTGNGTGRGSLNGSPGPNVFQGLVSGSGLQFIGIPVDAPGTNGHRIFRVTNVRANATGIGAGAGGAPGQVIALISSSGSATVPISKPSLVVGFVQPSLTTGLQNQASRPDNSWTAGTLTPVGVLRFPEGFGTAFKTRVTPAGGNQDVPGQIYNSESGFNPLILPSNTGLADFGTRLKAVFNNIPAGTRLFVSATNSNATGTSTALLTNGEETGVFVSVPSTATAPDGTKAAEIPAVNGTAAAVWEVINTNPNAIESMLFGVFFSHAPCSTRSDCPPVGASTVNMSFAPTPTGVDGTLQTKTNSDPIPRFVPAQNTGLPLPFVSQQAPFDAGIAISNTSANALAFVTITSSSGNPPVFELGAPFNIVPVPTLVFPYAQSGVVPYPVNIQALSSNGPINNFSLSATISGPGGSNELDLTSSAPEASGEGSREVTSGWLTVTANNTSTPATLTVSVNPTGLATGNYDGRITLTAAGIVNSPFNIPVRLAVSAAGPQFTAGGLANAATYFPAVVAPGEAIVIFGSRFGPPALATLALTPQGTVSTSIGQTRLLFDNVAAPMIYAANGQVSAFVPYSVADKTSTQVQVEYNGVKSPAVTIPVLDAVPGIFTLDQSGGGQGAVLNQDGSVNGASNPAKPGDIVQVFGTGAGQTTPAGQDGTLTGLPLPKQNLGITITIGGKVAEVVYAGPAPSLVAGVLQINARIPADVVVSNSVLVRAQIGDKLTQPGLTIAVR